MPGALNALIGFVGNRQQRIKTRALTTVCCWLLRCTRYIRLATIVRVPVQFAGGARKDCYLACLTHGPHNQILPPGWALLRQRRTAAEQWRTGCETLHKGSASLSPQRPGINACCLSITYHPRDCGRWTTYHHLLGVMRDCVTSTVWLRRYVCWSWAAHGGNAALIPLKDRSRRPKTRQQANALHQEKTTRYSRSFT